MRRLHVHLRSRKLTSAVAREVAALMGERLGWDAARVHAEVRRYDDALARAAAVLDRTASARVSLDATGTR
jgi:hypothetical protein